MVGSISSNSAVMQQQMSASSTSSSNSSSLSSSQLETISSVLQNYDASNLSSEDATAIVQAFEKAGIEPSEDLASAMKSEGFDAKEVGDAAGVGGPQGGGGMPPPPSAEEESDISSLLDALLSTEEDEDSTSSISDVMEYTSRILNLNEDSKAEVMDILDKYSSTETEYSQEEVSNIVKNSLSSILSDSDNYNNISFYA